MAQKRKKYKNQLNLLKKTKWLVEGSKEMDQHLDGMMESTQNYELEEGEQPIFYLSEKNRTKMDTIASDSVDEESASLNWLVNLSAASLFPTGAGHEAPTACNSTPTMFNGQIRNLKPGFTYTELIEKALKEKGELTVSEIYKWIYSRYPYYQKHDARWKNSIRHNLSINPQFRKGNKCSHGGHYWTLNKEYDDQFKKWQELRKTARDDRKRKITEIKDDETERATRSILLSAEDNCMEFNEDFNCSTGCTTDTPTVGTNDPNLVRVATDILNGIDRQVEVEFMDGANEASSAPIVIEEDIFESSDPILADPLLFSDCLELGFQPYELIDSRLAKKITSTLAERRPLSLKKKPRVTDSPTCPLCFTKGYAPAHFESCATLTDVRTHQPTNFSQKNKTKNLPSNISSILYFY